MKNQLFPHLTADPCGNAIEDFSIARLANIVPVNRHWPLALNIFDSIIVDTYHIKGL